MKIPEQLYTAAKNHPHPLLFATISGAHLYGFPSSDSDFDLRGVHILPLSDIVGLSTVKDTIESTTVEDGLELDLVTHDIKKFFSMMLKKNGYVLEQLYSPLVVQGGDDHDELKEIGKKCITRRHSHHYLGFSETQWRLFLKDHPRRVKPLLYVYRVLLTGINLMLTGEIEANLVNLNSEFKLAYINDLIALKLAGPEKQLITEDIAFHAKEYERLRGLLEEACASSHLPETPSAKTALDDMLKRIRLRAHAPVR